VKGFARWVRSVGGDRRLTWAELRSRHDDASVDAVLDALDEHALAGAAFDDMFEDLTTVTR
jgi:hypothetical protein